VTLDNRNATGLSRPDFFDWPAHLRDEVVPTHPEVIVIIFGANDAQSLQINGHVESVESPVWQAEYRRRVAETMDMLKGEGRLVIWVGQPVVRSSAFTAHLGMLDEIYASEAATRPWIRFLDTRPMFVDAAGQYSAYLPGDDGVPALMRQPDGIHLTRAGGDRLARAVLEALDREIAALAPPLPTTTSTI
jgi:hypothetical protein